MINFFFSSGNDGSSAPAVSDVGSDYTQSEDSGNGFTLDVVIAKDIRKNLLKKLSLQESNFIIFQI